MNKEQILKRMAEIADEIMKDDADVNALETESNELRASLEKVEKREKILAGLNTGNIEGRKIDMPDNKIENRSYEDIIASAEYRSAYLKTLLRKDLNDLEQRALTTATNSAGAAIPTTTLNMIIDKLRQTSALFNKVTVMNLPGNVQLTIAGNKNAASWTAEAADGTPADDTVIKVNLTGYKLIKLVEIDANVSVMSISQFEAYIAQEVARQMAIAIENAILNGSGSGAPTGILTGVTFDTTNSTTYSTTLSYDNLMDGMGLLPTPYHNSAVFVMNRKTLFGGVRKIKTDSKEPIFVYNAQDQVKNAILGYPVIVDDYIADDTILFGDFSYYYFNFSQPIVIESDMSIGFKSGNKTYRGLAIADGKPALSEAFVKIYKA